MAHCFLLAIAGTLMVHPATLFEGQVLLILTVLLMVPGSNPTEFTRAILAAAIGGIGVGAAAFAATWEGLGRHETLQTMRSLGIPLAWLLAVVLGWRRFPMGLWMAAAVNGLGHLAVAVQTVRLSPIYWENDLGWIGGESRIFVKIFDAPNLIYATTMSSTAFGAVIAGAVYFGARGILKKSACLACTLGFLAISTWLGNKASTYAVTSCWLLAYLVSSRGTGSLILKLAGLATVSVVVLLAFSERFANEGRAARLTGDFDPTFTGRTAIWADHIQDVWRYPLGVTINRATDEIGLTEHNTALQVARVFGWIPGAVMFCGLAVLALSIPSLWFAGGESRKTWLPFLIAGAGPCVMMASMESLALGASGAMYGLYGMIGVALTAQWRCQASSARASASMGPHSVPLAAGVCR